MTFQTFDFLNPWCLRIPIFNFQPECRRCLVATTAFQDSTWPTNCFFLIKTRGVELWRWWGFSTDSVRVICNLLHCCSLRNVSSAPHFNLLWSGVQVLVQNLEPDYQSYNQSQTNNITSFSFLLLFSLCVDCKIPPKDFTRCSKPWCQNLMLNPDAEPCLLQFCRFS